MISSASVSLWTYNLSWCWDQIFMCSNISFDRVSASRITNFLKFFKYNFRIRDVLLKIIVNCTLVSWNNRFPGIFSFMLARVYANMSSRSLLLIFNFASFIWCVDVYQCRTFIGNGLFLLNLCIYLTIRTKKSKKIFFDYIFSGITNWELYSFS